MESKTSLKRFLSLTLTAVLALEAPFSTALAFAEEEWDSAVEVDALWTEESVLPENGGEEEAWDTSGIAEESDALVEDVYNQSYELEGEAAEENFGEEPVHWEDIYAPEGDWDYVLDAALDSDLVLSIPEMDSIIDPYAIAEVAEEPEEESVSYTLPDGEDLAVAIRQEALSAVSFTLPKAPGAAVDVLEAKDFSDAEDDIEMVQADGTTQAAATTVSALQVMIQEKLSEVSASAKELVITLPENTKYTGDVKIDKKNFASLAADFVLKLIAGDAVPAKEGNEYQGEGSLNTIVDGNLAVSGMNVLLRGVALALGKTLSVEKAEVQYEGGKNTDTLNASVGEAGSLSVWTYGDKDSVTVNAASTANSVYVDTGDEDDTVNLVQYGGNASILGGSGDDTLNLQSVEGAGFLTAEGGAGKDTISAKLAGSGGAALKGGAGNDAITVDTLYGVGDVEIEGGEGSDVVSIAKSDEMASESASAVFTVKLGDGNDRLNLDLSSAKSVSSVSVTGGDGEDRFHLTGSLDGDTDAAKRIQKKGSGYVFTAEGKKSLELTISGVENMTDSLANKRTVALSEAGGKFEDFTNYEVKLGKDGEDVTAAGEEKLFSNLVITTDGKKPGVIDAKGLNVLVTGTELTFNKEIYARNLVLEATSKAEQRLFLTGDIKSQYYNTASITLEKGAALYALKDIDLTSKVEQKGANDLILSLVAPYNIRFGTASVHVKDGASINAGYDLDTKEKSSSSRGTVSLSSSIVAEGTSGGALPIGVGVMLEEAEVLVDKGAVVNASGDIRAEASSVMKENSTVTSSLGSLPMGIAVNVLKNKVTVNVDGTLSAGGDVSLKAKGEIDSTASAVGGASNLSTGFFGVNVVLQDVLAKIGANASVTAGGGVSVTSSSKKKVTTAGSKASPQPKKAEESSAIAVSGAALGKTVLSKIKEGVSALWHKIRGNAKTEADKEIDKLNKTMDAAAGGENSLTLADDSEKTGDVEILTYSETSGNLNKKMVSVDVKPWDGYKVAKVYARYLNREGSPSDTYQIVEANYDEETKEYVFPQLSSDMYIYVEYERGSVRTEDGEDIFDLEDDDFVPDANSSINDVTGSTRETEDEDYDLSSFDESERFAFQIVKTEDKDDDGLLGAVLTEKFELAEVDGQTVGKSITQAAPGMKVVFVVNPREGYKLSEGGLAVSYWHNDESGKKVEEVVILEDDGNGRYIFTVPADILKDGYKDAAGKGIGFQVESSFEKADEEETGVKRGSGSKTQINAGIAVAVVLDTNEAVIADGSTVTAGGALKVASSDDTTVTTKADTSAADKAELAKAAAGKTQEKKQEEMTLSNLYLVPAREVAFTLEKVTGGTVDVTRDSAYGYTFTATSGGKAAAGAKAVLTYVSSGKTVQETLTADANGRIKVNLTKYSIDKGTRARLSVTLTGSGSQEAVELVANPINVSYNALKPSKDEDPLGLGQKKIGEVYYEKTTGEGADAKYYFAVKPDADKGYTLNAADAKDKTKSNTSYLYASYKNASGKEVKVALRQDAGSSLWYVSMADCKDLPAGAVLTVNAKFTEDLHNLEKTALTEDGSSDGKYSEDERHGNVTFSKTSAKATDTVTITATAKDNYVPKSVLVSYQDAKTGATTVQVLELNDKGEAELTVPGLASGTKIYVDARFAEKSITWTKENSSDEVVYPATGHKLYAGEKVTFALTKEAQEAGKKVDSVTVTYTNDKGERSTQNLSVKNGAVTIPKDAQDSQNIIFSVKTKEKALELEDATQTQSEEGKLSLAEKRADRGEKLTVKVEAKTGYYLDSGKAILVADGQRWQVKLKRVDDTKFTLTLPAALRPEKLNDKTVEITLSGTFKKGYAEDSVETSFGAGVAVNVVREKSRALIEGGQITAGSVKVTSAGTEAVSLETKAGYSTGNVGISGAVGVQVANISVDALVKAGSGHLTTGSLALQGKSKVGLSLSADASGGKTAENAGVGAGIGVSVSSSHVNAGVQDGVNLKAKDAQAGLSELTVAAVQSLEDKLAAKAGASGGVGVTPVVALDILSGSAVAYLGNTKEAVLSADKVDLKATNEAKHTVSADASAAGKSAAVGGAFAVTVLSDEAKALLQESVKSGTAVSVAASQKTQVTVNSTASAAGGVKGKAKKDGSGGSADSQVDQILSGGSSIASKSGNSKALAGAQNRQKAQTSEGSIAGAGAVTVNILTSTSRAELTDGVSVTGGADLSVTSENRTVAEIKANASTTKSDTGVGVGVAVNVLNVNNLALIGNGTLDVGSLTVKALMPEVKAKITEVKPVATKDEMATSLAASIAGAVNDFFKQMGLDTKLVGELTGAFSEAFITTVLKETGLEEILGTGSFEEKIDQALNSFSSLLTSLKNYPKEMLEPLISAAQQFAGLTDMTAEQWKDIAQNVLSEATAQVPKLLSSTLSSTLNAAKDGLIGGALAYVNAKLQGKTLAAGEAAKTVKAKLKTAVKAELSLFVDTLLQDALTRLSGDLPMISQENLDLMKSAVKTSFDQKLESLYESVTTTFQQKVFNYTLLAEKLERTDFLGQAKTILQQALKNAGVNMGTKALDGLLQNMDVQLSAPDNSKKNVYTTQAISGVGAKDVGIAGGVAITVLNGKTQAVIASGAKITAAGAVLLDAREEREVKNVASASADKKGDADTNKNGGDKDKKDKAGSDAVQKVQVSDKIVVTGTTGLTLAQDSANAKKVYLDLSQGYEFTSGAKAKYIYTEGSEEKTGEIEIKSEKNGSETRYYLDLSSASLPDETVNIKPEPTEKLLGISGCDGYYLDSDGNVPDGTVTVKVEGRTVENGVLKVRPGEMVQVVVDRTKVPGFAVDEVEFSNKSGSATPVLKIASTNEKEIIYTFQMPDEEVARVDVWLTKTEEEEPASEATNDKGTSVGVGAAFSMVYGDTQVEAVVHRDIESGSLSLNADADHSEAIYSVAGTDPLSGQSDTKNTKDVSVDASAALNVLDNTVKARVEGSVTTKDTESGDLKVTSSENSATETKASSFAVGSATAVGAAVAINIAGTEVTAGIAKDAVSAGAATVAANSFSQDDTEAFATAMGADIARGIAKVTDKTTSLEKDTNSLMDGSYFNDKAKDKTDKTNSNNQTATNIKQKLDKKGSNEGGETSEKLSLSTNVLRNQNVQTEDGTVANDAKKTATDKVNDPEGTKTEEEKKKNPVSLGDSKEEKSKFQVAAAVGVTVASHEAQAQIGGNLTAGGALRVSANNAGNFQTLGTGAAMSLASKANSIAAGVAVSVNNNKAKVTLGGDVKAGGDVALTSALTQNMDGIYKGKLGVQSLAGSVAGADSDVSIGGAISVLVSHAESTVDVAGYKRTGDEDQTYREISGDTVTISATDKSKLAGRAGGLSISKGSSVGMGIAVTTIVSGNTVQASVGDNTHVEAADFSLEAKKLAVTMEDFKLALSLKDLVTDSSKLSDEERQNAETGILDLKKKKKDGTYSVKVKMNSEDLLKAFDALNFLSSTNYYAEAIAGSISTGSNTKFSAAGSFAVSHFNNTIQTLLGRNALVETKKTETAGGNVTVGADGESNVRLIAGALSATKGKNALGLTVAYLGDHDNVLSKVGDASTITADGNVSHTAKVDSDIQLFTGAAAAAKGAEGGVINVIVTDNKAKALLGAGSVVKAGGKYDLTADTDMDLTLISADVNVAKDGTAAGGAVNVIVDNAVSKAKAYTGHQIDVTGDVTLRAKVNENLISGLAVASAANGDAVAGAASVLVSNSKSNLVLGAGTGHVKSLAGNLEMLGRSDTTMANVTLSAAGSSGKGIGASFNINVFNREAGVFIGGAEKKDDYQLGAGKNMLVQAYGRDLTVMGSLAASLAKDVALSGNIPVIVDSSRTRVKVYHTDTDEEEDAPDDEEDDGYGFNAVAGESMAFESHYSDRLYALAGTIAGSLSDSAAGATALTVVKNNWVLTELGTSSMDAMWEKASSTGLADRLFGAGQTEGIYVGATADETFIAGAAGIAGAMGSAFNLNVNTYVNNNTVRASAEKALLRTRLGGGVTLEAKNNATELLVAGGLNFSAGSGVGASAVTTVSNKTVEAKAGNIESYGDVNISAEAPDKLMGIAVNVGISGSSVVSLGAVVQVLRSNAEARVADGATVLTETGNVNLSAVKTLSLDNAAVAVGVSANASATPVGTVTYMRGGANASLGIGSKILTGENGQVSITADTSKDINQYTIGAAASGNVGLSGTVNIMVAKNEQALATTALNSVVSGNGPTSSPGKAKSLSLHAKSSLKLRTVNASVGVAGNAGIAVNAVVTVLKANVATSLGGKADTSEDVTLHAEAPRDVLNVAGTVGGGGSAGIGATVMVLVAGEKMSQDAYDMLHYGNADSKDGQKTFDEDQFKTDLAGAGIDVGNNLNDLNKDLASNNKSYSSEHVGSEKTGSDDEKQAGFDAESGYRSGDFDSESADEDAGSDAKMKESSDLKNAQKVGTYTYSSALNDGVTSTIEQDAVVTARSVTVEARQSTLADLYGATAAFGGIAGAGVSTAVAVMHSNVFATIDGTVNLTGGDATVSAISEAVSPDKLTEAEAAEEKSRSEALGKALGDKLDPTNRSIRAVGITAAGGTVGIGAAVAVVLTDNVTQARVSGTVTGVENMYVTAKADYRNILAATVAASGGAAAVSASAAVAQSNGEVNAIIGEGAKITTTKTTEARKLEVTTDTQMNANAVAVAAAVGGFAANGGLALASNRMKQNTYIERGASVRKNSAGTVKITADNVTNSDAFLLGASIGLAAVGINGAVTIVEPTVRTGLGYGSSGQAASLVARTSDVTIGNTLSSKASPVLLNVAIGGLTMVGNALLAFNKTDAEAKVQYATLQAANAKVGSEISAKSTSSLKDLSVGAAALGVNVNYVDLNARNASLVDTTGSSIMVQKDFEVVTGKAKALSADLGRKKREDQLDTLAKAEGATIKAGLVTAGINTAIARNRTVNLASVSGGNSLTVGKNLTVQSFGQADSIAKMFNFEVGLESVGASTTVALMEAANQALVSVPAVVMDKDTDKDSDGEYGRIKVQADQTAVTDAVLESGGGSLYEAKSNVAVAYGKAKSEAQLVLAEQTYAQRGVLVSNSQTDLVKGHVVASGLGGISAVVNVGGAYAQDELKTKVDVHGLEAVSSLPAALTKAAAAEDKEDEGKFKVENTFRSEAVTDVIPAGGGLSLTLAGLKTNLSLAEASFKVTNDVAVRDGKLSAKDISIVTDGSVVSDAVVNTPAFSVSALGVAINVVSARSTGTQDTKVTLENASMEAAESFTLKGIYETARAKGLVGGTGAGKSASLIGGTAHVAEAKEGVTSTVSLEGTRDTHLVKAQTVDVYSGMKEGAASSSHAEARNAVSVSLATLGSLYAKADTGDIMKTKLSQVDVQAGGNINVASGAKTASDALGTDPGSVTAVSISVTTVNGVIGGDKAQTSQVELGDGVSLAAGGVLTLKAGNNGTVQASMEKATSYSLGAVNKSTIPTTSSYLTGVTVGRSAALSGKQGVNISSEVQTGATSVVNGKSLALAVDINSMRGDNTESTESSVKIGDGSTVKATSGNVNIYTKSNTNMTADSNFESGSIFRSGNTVKAVNTLTRYETVELGQVTVTASGNVAIENKTGLEEKIYTNAQAIASSLFANAQGVATTDIDSRSKVRLFGTKVTANGDIRVISDASVKDLDTVTFDQTNGAAKIFSVNSEPKATSTTYLGNTANVELEGISTGVRASLTSKKGNVDIFARSTSLDVNNWSKADGNGYSATGKSYCYSYLYTGIEKTVYIGNADISGKAVTVKSYDTDNYRLNVYGRGYLTGVHGDVYVTSALSNLSGGSSGNYIRTNSAGTGAISLSADSATVDAVPMNVRKHSVEASAAHTTISIIKSHSNPVNNASFNRVNELASLSATAPAPDIDPSEAAVIDDTDEMADESNLPADFVEEAKELREEMEREEAERQAEEEAQNEQPQNEGTEGTSPAQGEETAGTVPAQGGEEAGGAEPQAQPAQAVEAGTPAGNQQTQSMLPEEIQEEQALADEEQAAGLKALVPDEKDEMVTQDTEGVVRAEVISEGARPASELYDFEKVTDLTEDRTLSKEELLGLYLYERAAAGQKVYLLPNGTKVILLAGEDLMGVAEQIYDDLDGDGEQDLVHVSTVLTESDYEKGELLLGQKLLLNAKRGTLQLADGGMMTLQPEEVSGSWMLQMFMDGDFQVPDVDASGMSPAQARMQSTSKGILYGILSAEDAYYVGRLPGEDTAYGFTLDEEKDVLSAFIEKDGERRNASLLVFRDEKSDAWEEIIYDVVFLAEEEPAYTFINEGAEGKALTNLSSLTLQVNPAADYAYLLGGEGYVLALAGEEREILDGYTASYEDGTLSSPYVDVTEDLTVTLKKGQQVWGER